MPFPPAIIPGISLFLSNLLLNSEWIMMNAPPLLLFWLGRQNIKPPKILYDTGFLFSLLLSLTIGIAVFWAVLGFPLTFPVYYGFGYFYYAYIGALSYLVIMLAFVAYTKHNEYNRDKYVNPLTSLILGLCAVYAIGNLWEWPIFLSTWLARWDALVYGFEFALPKFVAAMIFFYILVRAGWNWRHDSPFFWLLSATLAYGTALYLGIVLNAGLNIYFLHINRLFWGVTLFWAFIKTPAKGLR